MGSINFEHVYLGDASVNDAYAEAVADARSEHGHDPYNGTISTTSGVALVSVPPMTMEQASELANIRIENLSKWENCEAIPLVRQTMAEYEQLPDVELQLVVSGETYNDAEQLHAVARKTLRLSKTIEITSCQLKVNRGFEYAAGVEKRVIAEAPKEKTETRYFILTGLGKVRGDQLEWDKGYPTQAAARAALGSVLRYDFHRIPDVNAEIVGLTRRSSGAPLVSATVSAKKVDGTFIVKTRKITKAATVSTERVGYYFYGWAAC